MGRNPDNKLIFSQSSTLAQHQQLCTHTTPAQIHLQSSAQRGGVMNIQPKLIKLMHVFVKVYQTVFLVLMDQSFHFCG